MTTTSSTNSLSSLLNSLSPTGSGSSSGSSGTGGALLSSLGIGSGLDVNSIVTALVNDRAAAPQQAINQRTSQITTQLGGLTQLQQSLSSLQSSLSALTTASTYQTFTANLTGSGGSNIGTVSASTGAQPGSYKVVVNNLATAQSRASSAMSATAAVGAGTLQVTVGSSTMNVSVSATDTLSNIASSINASSSNPGVNATVINGVNGEQLILTSQKTGVANGFSVSASGSSSAGLTSLANSLNTAGSNEATDASLTINGIAVTSSTNTVASALQGVTLNLTATGTSQLVVAQDPTVAEGAIQGFVTAYNSYVSATSSLASYDPTSKQAGPLLGNATLSSIQGRISSILTSAVKGNSIGTLASLGITRQPDGTLSVNSGTLNKACAQNSTTVQSLFSATNGYGTTLNNTLTLFTDSTNGILTTQVKNLNANLAKVKTQQSDLNARMAVYQQQLQAQYTQLDTLMSQLNNTSSYLKTALDQLTNSNSKN